MAEESGFFTSVAGDRKYNAAFMNRKLYEVLQRKDGVLSCDGELVVSKVTGRDLNIATGVAIKGGIYYRNTTALSLTLSSLPLMRKRRDRIVLHIDRYIRTMKVTVLKGVEATNPVAPGYSIDDDILLAQALIDYAGGMYAVTLTDERQMRPVFITNEDSIDTLSEGQTYGRVLKEKADKINTGQLDIAFRKFIFVGKGWTDNSRVLYSFALMSDGLTMLMGTSGETKLWRSYDFGISWNAESGVTVDSCIWAIVLNGTATFVAGGSPARIYRSAPPYMGWTMVAENLGRESFSSLLVIDSMNMLAGCDNDVYASVNGGMTWLLRGTIQNEDLVRIRVFESLGNGIILAAGQGSDNIFRSNDAGATWSTVKTTGYGVSPHPFMKHINNGIVLFGFEDEGRVYRSIDYGLTWDSGIRLDDWTYYPCLLIDGNKLYLPVKKSIYVSEDSGATWTKEHEFANVSQIMEICKCANGITFTLGLDGYVFWGYPFDV